MSKQFRAEFTAFLDEHLPTRRETAERPQSCSHIPEWARRWQRAAVRPRLAAAGQPAGVRRPQRRRYCSSTCTARNCRERRIYHSFNPQGVGIVAASILSFGTDEQKQQWAVPILRGRDDGVGRDE